jgi:hypothetical protein
MTARQAKSQRRTLWVTDGSRAVGLIEQNDSDFTAFGPDRQALGTYSTLIEAVRAVPPSREGS